MKQKTVMMQLLDKISRLDYCAEPSDAWVRLKEFIKTENLLEKEEKQIIDACQEGFYCGNDIAKKIKPQYKSSPEYYSLTYKSDNTPLGKTWEDEDDEHWNKFLDK